MLNVGEQATMSRRFSSTSKRKAAADTLVVIAREHASSRGATPPDVRPHHLRVITKELGLSLDTKKEEAFYVGAAHEAGLSGRQLGHLMREFTEIFVSRIRKARLSGRARRALKRYPPVTAEHFGLSLGNAVKVAKALGGKLVV